MSAATTRRGLLAGAAAGAAVPLLARGEAVADAAGDALPPSLPAARRAIVRRGRAVAVSPRGDRVVVAHDRLRTIAVRDRSGTRVIDVGGQPLDVAVSPDGRLAAVPTASWDRPALALVDLVRGTLIGRLDVGPAPSTAAFTADGARIVVAGGEQEGTVHVVDRRRRAVTRSVPVGIVPRGLAVTGDRAWVALNGDGRVVAVDLHRGRVAREVRTPALPDRLAASADGRRLLVSHGVRDADHVSVVDLGSGRATGHVVGPQPAAVAFARDGALVVALGGAPQVVVVRAGRRRRIAVTGAPRDLAVAGSRAWVVDGLTDAVSRVRV